jgi:O-antigen ligase
VSAVAAPARPASPVGSGGRAWSVIGWTLVVLALGIAVVLPEPLITIGAVVAVAIVVATFIQPLVAVPLLLFAVPFGGLLRSAGGDAAEGTSDLAFGAAELIIALLMAAWLAHAVRRRELHVRSGPVVFALLGMTALALVSVGYALDPSLALKESLKWLELLLALLIVADLTRTPGTARIVIGALFAAGGAEAAFGVVQFATGGGPGAFALDGALRAFGHFDQPNPFAGYLATILPLAVCMALCRTNPVGYRWFAAVAAGLLAAAIALSQSRGAWLGCGVAAICLLLAWNRRTRGLLVPLGLGGVLLLAMALAGLLPASILDRLSQITEYFGVFDVRTVEVSSENWAIVERMAHWQAGWDMFLAHPWLGVGAGNYEAAYPEYFIGMWREALGHAHNYYLNMLAELGVVGAAVLLVLLGLVFRQFGGALVASDRLAPQPDLFWRAVLAGVFGGLVVFCVHNLFDSLFVHSVNIQVGVLLGLGLIAVDRVHALAADEVSAR